jgi:glucose uptake protein
MGCIYPFVSKAMTGERSLGPYAALLFFVIGVKACSIPVNYLLMRMPLDGREPASMSATGGRQGAGICGASWAAQSGVPGQ